MKNTVVRVLSVVLIVVVSCLSVLVLGGEVSAAPRRGPSLDQERQLVLRSIDRVDVAVTRATDARRLRGLDVEVQDAVLANADLDHAGLDALADDAAAASSRDQLRAVGTELRTYRPESYVVVVTALRATARMTVQVAAARDAVPDDADVQTLADEADLAVQEATDAALGVTATSGRTVLRTVGTQVVAAHRAVGAVEDAVEAALAAG